VANNRKEKYFRKHKNGGWISQTGSLMGRRSMKRGRRPGKDTGLSRKNFSRDEERGNLNTRQRWWERVAKNGRGAITEIVTY